MINLSNNLPRTKTQATEWHHTRLVSCCIHVSLYASTVRNVLWVFCMPNGAAGHNDVSEDLGPLQRHHIGHDGVSNHQPYHCSLNRLFGRRSKKTSKLRVTGLRVGNSPRTGEIPAQMASNAKNVSIWWRHHATCQNTGRLSGYRVSCFKD